MDAMHQHNSARPVSAASLKLTVCVSAALLIAGCSSESTSPIEPDCPTDSGEGCAAESVRVDLYSPSFSNPTTITNPLLPMSELDSVVYTGTVDGLPFRTETTLLSGTEVVEYEGQQIETVVVQYMAFSNGRIEEIATDNYAQDDSGAVWYLGEDVADYDETGEIFTHEGTWHAGVNGAPIAMNMPPVPAVGDAWLAEDTPPEAWEQITVMEVDVPREGPSGQVAAVITAELKLDNSGEEKVFAPGYGELSTGSLATDNLEALALAIPTDALSTPTPSELKSLATATANLFKTAGEADWSGATTALNAVGTNWDGFRTGDVPPRLKAETDRILLLLTAAVEEHDAQATRHHAIDLTRFIYDLRLRHEPSTEINRVRFDLWLAQVEVDAAVDAVGPVRGDTATLELVWQRIAHTFDASAAAQIEDGLAALRTAADADDTVEASLLAAELRGSLAESGWK